jgi:hypothetical protein
VPIPTPFQCPQIKCSVACFADPCSVNKCSARPDAKCCGDCNCNASFHDPKTGDQVKCEAPDFCATVLCADKATQHKLCAEKYGDGKFMLVEDKCPGCFSCQPIANPIDCSKVLCVSDDEQKKRCQAKFGDQPFTLEKDQCGCAQCKPSTVDPCATVDCVDLDSLKADCVKKYGDSSKFQIVKGKCCHTCEAVDVMGTKPQTKPKTDDGSSSASIVCMTAGATLLASLSMNL